MRCIVHSTHMETTRRTYCMRFIGHNFHFTTLKESSNDATITRLTSRRRSQTDSHTHTQNPHNHVSYYFHRKQIEIWECEWGKKCMHTLHANKMKVKIGLVWLWLWLSHCGFEFCSPLIISHDSLRPLHSRLPLFSSSSPIRVFQPFFLWCCSAQHENRHTDA